MATTGQTHEAKRPARRISGPSDEPLPDVTSISELREVAKACHRCPLWRDATQTVFGEGLTARR